MREFLEMTLWKTPEMGPYGWFHFGFLAIGMPLCWYFARRLGRAATRPQQVNAVLRVTSLALIATEIYKQLLFYFVLGHPGYDWGVLPLQYCSLPMYLGLIASFLKEGRARQTILDYLLWFNLLGAGMAFVGPQGMFWGYWTLTIHSFLWHLVLIFLGLFLYYSGVVSTEGSRFSDAALLFGAFVVMAIAIDVVPRGDNTVNLFFLSPYEGNTIAVFSTIYAKFGWWITNTLFLGSILLGAYGIYRWTWYLRKKHVQEKQSEIAVSR